MYHESSYKTPDFSSMNFLLDSQNLICMTYETGKMSINTNSVSEHVLNNPGHFLFSFFNNNNSMGHAMGLRHENGMLEIFDPNGGLFKYENREGFRSMLDFYLLSRKERYNGNWYIYEVKLEK